MNKSKSKSEGKRVVSQQKCSSCHDKCGCHKPLSIDCVSVFWGCSCPTSPVSLSQKMNVDFVKAIVDNYDKLRELIKSTAEIIWEDRHGVQKHGMGAFISFDIDGESIVATYDTSCCGSWDQDEERFPIAYIVDPVQSLEIQKRVIEKREEEERAKEQLLQRQQSAKEAEERKLLKELKEKYEIKKPRRRLDKRKEYDECRDILS